MTLLSNCGTTPRGTLWQLFVSHFETESCWKSLDELFAFWKGTMSTRWRMRLICYKGNVYVVGNSFIMRLHVFRFTDPMIGAIAYAQWRRYYGKQQNVNGQ